MRHCDSCEVLFINGLKCHERGCPDAWRDDTRTCEWCGCEFKPETPRQAACSYTCHASRWDLAQDGDDGE